VCNFGVSRENLFDMYGDSLEKWLEILAVVKGARRRGALAPQLSRATLKPLAAARHPK